MPAKITFSCSKEHILFLGDPHQYTVLSELAESLVNKLDKVRVEAQQRESEGDKLVKDTIAALKKWDKRTEELVSQLQQARDEHVSKQSGVTYAVRNKFHPVYSQVNAL